MYLGTCGNDKESSIHLPVGGWVGMVGGGWVVVVSVSKKNNYFMIIYVR